LKTSPLQIVYQPREDASAEGEIHALAAVYRFVLLRREQYDLTNDLATEMTKNGPRKTEQENT
jgi:hypothetical protein